MAAWPRGEAGLERPERLMFQAKPTPSSLHTCSLPTLTCWKQAQLSSRPVPGGEQPVTAWESAIHGDDPEYGAQAQWAAGRPSGGQGQGLGRAAHPLDSAVARGLVAPEARKVGELCSGGLSPGTLLPQACASQGGLRLCPDTFYLPLAGPAAFCSSFPGDPTTKCDPEGP